MVIVSLLYSNTNTYLVFIPKVNQASAATWYNASWLYRIKITTDHTKVGSTLTNFPVYVNLANLPLEFFSHVNSDGSDIRVTTSDGTTEVPVEVVAIDTTAKIGELHFKAPSLSTSVDTDFYIYYGNSGASAYAVTDTYGRNNVWTNGYKTVLHLNTKPSVDSTGNLSNSKTNTFDLNTGQKIGSGASFNNTSAKSMDFAYNSALNFGNGASDDTPVTFSAWAKGDGGILGSSVPSATNIQFLFTYVGGTARSLFYSTTGSSRIGQGTTSAYSTSAWTYVVSTYDGKKINTGIKIFINGSSVALTGADGPNAYTGMKNSISSELNIGKTLPGTAYANYFNGQIDEVRIAGIERSSGWVTTEYNNQNSPATFYSVGSEETQNSAPIITSASDSPDPVEVGQDVTFSVGFTDADGDGVKTYICKTNAFTAGVGCDGGAWAKQDSSFSLTTPQIMTYTTTITDVGNNIYYPFIEDPSGATTSASASSFTVPALWYNVSWANRIKITVDNTKVSSTLTNFPVYVDLANLPLEFFSHVNSDGSDIRVTTSDGTTEVPVEVVAIDTTAKTGELHFKAPSLSSSVDTDFYIYYGNASASAPAVTATYGRNNVWTEYKAVYHMTEGNAVDSTGNGHTGTNTSTTDIAGKLGRGRDFDKGATTKITLDTTVMSDNTATPLTVSAWVKADTITSAMKILNKASLSGVGGLQFGISNAGEWLWWVCDSGGSNRIGLSSPAGGAGTTRYLVGTYDGSKVVGGMALYKDGTTVGSTISSDTLGSSYGISSYSMWIGNRETTSQPWDGFIDEVRIAQVNRSADWVATEYNNQNSPSTFYTIGSEEGSAPAGTLSVDIVDTGDSSVASPSITLSPIDFSFSDQTSTGVFGTSNEKIRIDNNTSTATWTVSIAPNAGPTSLWQGASNQYDFNDTSVSPTSDDGDVDNVGGKMTIDPTVSTITPEAGCDLTNISTGGSASFAEGVTDSITLASATTGANINCSWDITDIGVSQTIPAEQPADSYSIDMTISIIAS